MIEKTIDMHWRLHAEDRLLKRGGAVYRYSHNGMMNDRRDLVPVEWEEQLLNGAFLKVTDPDLIRQLNDAVQVRLAVLADPEANRLRS